MKWLDQLNRAVDYIEANLEGEIGYDKAAQIACCSTFHFRRMFSYIAGVSLSEYIRRRKMTRAAFELQSSSARVIDLALKYGYDSPTAFNRAFKSVHGLSPQKAKAENTVLKSFLPITFKIQIKGDVDMNYRILSKPAFNIIGVKRHYDMNVEENFKDVPMFWQQTYSQIPRILAQNNQEPNALLGVSTCMNGQDFDYYIAVASDQTPEADFTVYTVPECTWAVFECVGPMPNAIQSLQKRILTEWLPASGYEYADAPDIEVYFEGDQMADDYVCEVWLPVVKR